MKLKNSRLTGGILLFVLLLALTGCKGKEIGVVYTFTSDADHSIDISFQTTEGHEMTQTNPFMITKDGKKLSTGLFLKEHGFQYYEDTYLKDSDITILEKGTTENGNPYYFWSEGDKEFNYVISITGAERGLLLENDVSKESAMECFRILSVAPTK